MVQTSRVFKHSSIAFTRVASAADSEVWLSSGKDTGTPSAMQMHNALGEPASCRV